MSSSERGPPEQVDAEEVDAETVGGFGEIVPEPLAPAWRRVESVQEFRRIHGETYVSVLEAIVGLALTAGFLYWLSLYLAA